MLLGRGEDVPECSLCDSVNVFSVTDCLLNKRRIYALCVKCQGIRHFIYNKSSTVTVDGRLLGSVGHRVKIHNITPVTGKERGDLEITT